MLKFEKKKKRRFLAQGKKKKDTERGIITVFKYVKGSTKEDVDQLLSLHTRGRENDQGGTQVR